MRPKSYPIWLLLLCALICSDVPATERVSRKLDSSNGPLIPPVFGLAQDTEGFIWIGTVAGLVRYDGSEMRPWAKGMITRDASLIGVSANGEVVAAEYAGALYHVIADGVEPVPGPDGQPLNGVTDVTFDGLGQLWVTLKGGDVLTRDVGKTWHSLNAESSFPGERVRRIRQVNDSDMFVLTDKAVWLRRADGTQRKILQTPHPIDVVSKPDGSAVVLSWPYGGELTEVRDGRATLLLKLPARPIDLVMRGDVIWASFDRFLVSLRGTAPPEIIGPEDNLSSGGPLLVDQEGSLWLGTFTELIQYPEPETIVWTEKDGLPSNHTRWLARTEEGIWVTCYVGLARIAQDHGVWHARGEKIQNSRAPCVDSQGALWASSPRGLERRAIGGSFVKRSGPDTGSLFMCAPTTDSALWLATRRGLFRAYEDDRPANAFKLPPGDDGQSDGILAVYEDRNRTLWVSTTEGRICHAAVTALDSNQDNAWSCQDFGVYIDTFDFFQLPSGDLWAATSRGGLLRFHNGVWAQHPASRTLASPNIFSVRPSPSGGVWIMGEGTSIRVVENTASPEGWTILESLSGWEGLRASGGGDLIEEPGGQVWITTSHGVVQVPKEARLADASPPRVKLVEVVVNGQRLALGEAPPQLPDGSNVELHFAALSYRDRGRLRYQYRLRHDANWIDVRDTSPLLRFVDLSAGRYQAEVRASLDGKQWSTEPALLWFQVLSPWYLRPWAIGLFVLFSAAALYLLYRTRVAVLISLERQRAEIAMDLHDEMGSGLGSIGILSELATEDNLDRLKRRELTKEIAQTAGELGTALTEIVWTLRPGTTSLESLAYHLAERAGRLFPAEAPSFGTEFPSPWPRVELSLAVRRNVLLIASEALHNAARHAHARRVVLGVAPAGNRWRLWIVDDGHGIDSLESANVNGGMGLKNMRRRAGDIQAKLSFETNGSGTCVSVVFEPKAEGVQVR